VSMVVDSSDRLIGDQPAQRGQIEKHRPVKRPGQATYYLGGQHGREPYLGLPPRLTLCGAFWLLDHKPPTRFCLRHRIVRIAKGVTASYGSARGQVLFWTVSTVHLTCRKAVPALTAWAQEDYCHARDRREGQDRRAYATLARRAGEAGRGCQGNRCGRALQDSSTKPGNPRCRGGYRCWTDSTGKPRSRRTKACSDGKRL
jgi:hypothetical protein